MTEMQTWELPTLAAQVVTEAAWLGLKQVLAEILI
jgi:hypothetical protein